MLAADQLDKRYFAHYSSEFFSVTPTNDFARPLKTSYFYRKIIIWVTEITYCSVNGSMNNMVRLVFP